MTEVRRRDGDGMGGLRDGSAGFEELRERAVALRREGLSRRQIRDRLKVHNKLLDQLLAGEPPPEWTKRPNAKDDLRAKARELRLRGMTYDQIELELRVSKSSISLWVRDLPKPPSRLTVEERIRPMQEGLARRHRERDIERHRQKLSARQEVGALSERDLMTVGVALYWAEGRKDKPYDRREAISFVNSDPNVIGLFLRWLELLGVEKDRLRCTVSIHETGDVAEATRLWSDLVGIPAEKFRKPGIKKHNPKTTRKNVGPAYHGCLAIYVTRSADLYRRVEGWWYGIVVASRSDTHEECPN